MTSVTHDSAVSDSASAVSEPELEYVSPFRDATAVQIAQKRRLARYPTVSATSGYSTVNPKDMGYKNIESHQHRAKDIAFPVYLTNNEKRQAILLEKLRKQEGHLKYLKDSQVITDLTTKPAAEGEDEDEDEEEGEDDEDAEEGAEENAAKGEADEGEEGEADEGEEEGVVEEEKDEVKEADEAGKSEEAEEPAAGVHAESSDANAAEAELDLENRVKERGDAAFIPEVPELSAPFVPEVPEVPEAVEAGAVSADAVPTAPKVAVLPLEEPEATIAGENEEAQAEAEEIDQPEEHTEEHTEEEDGKLDEEETAEGTKAEALSPPIDPALAPRVPIPDDNEKSFKLSFFKSHPAPEFPIATPENPEEIVKTDKEGYLNKAVYDKVQYETKVHNDWIDNFRKIEEKKYYDKKLEYSNKLKAVQFEIDEIHSQMEELRKETQKTLDICEGELTRKMLENTQVHVNKKHKIFKETDFLKEQNLNEKATVIDKSAALQQEIDSLNESKSEVQAEYIGWSNRLADLSAHVDAKVAKLFSVTENSRKTQAEIEKLRNSKKELEAEIESNKVKHAENSKVLENVENKEYLPKLHDIDNQISTLLSQMALIKQESANERCEISAITKKIEEERRAHEEKLQLEAEERKRKEEDLLNKQRIELETQAEENRIKHEEELTKLKESYAELETKLQDQETKHQELEKLQEDERLKASEREKELEELREAEKVKASEREKELEELREAEKVKASEREKELEKLREAERVKANESEKELKKLKQEAALAKSAKVEDHAEGESLKSSPA